MTTSGDTQALPRIPVPGFLDGPVPTVALTIAVATPEATTPEPAAVRPETAPAEAAAETPESHDLIYEEAMATIAALASSWSSAVQCSSGRHRAAA